MFEPGAGRTTVLPGRVRVPLAEVTVRLPPRRTMVLHGRVRVPLAEAMVRLPPGEDAISERARKLDM